MASLNDLQTSMSNFGTKLLAKLTTHFNNTNNPHNTTAAQLNAYTKAQTDTAVSGVQSAVTAHTTRTDNPHAVSPSQIGAATPADVLAAVKAVGLGGVDPVPYIVDLDNSFSLAAGLYYYNTSSLDVPATIAGTQGLVIHKIYGDAGFQLVQPYAVDRLLWRRRDTTGWMPWQELVDVSAIGAANGIASLDANKLLPVAQLPATVALTTAKNTWKAAQAGLVVPLNFSGSTVPVDFGAGNNFSVTLDGNYTLDIPDAVVGNTSPGQSGVIAVKQDATGSRALSYSSRFIFPNGTAPVLTTTPGALDLLCYYIPSSGQVELSLVANVK